MDIQNELLQRFKKLYGNPTYKEVSSLTGIQMTRVFRIFNGMEMKLSEYLVVKSLIDEFLNSTSQLDQLLENCKLRLSEDSLNEVKRFCERQLLVNELVANKSTKEVA